MRDYREKDVEGIMAVNFKMYKVPVTVRATADHRGQSLSLNIRDIMIQIPLEPVSDIIQLTKKGE